MGWEDAELHRKPMGAGGEAFTDTWEEVEQRAAAGPTGVHHPAGEQRESENGEAARTAAVHQGRRPAPQTPVASECQSCPEVCDLFVGNN